MNDLFTPGVYVQEVETGSKPIEGVSTSTCAFIGYAKSGPINEPILITSWSQFVATFGEDEKAYVAGLRTIVPEKHPADILDDKLRSRKTWRGYADSVVSKKKREAEEAARNAANGAGNGAAPGNGVGPIIYKTLDEFLESNKIERKGYYPYIDNAYLAHAIFGFYLNGGGRAYVVRVARQEDLDTYATPAARLIPPTEPTLIGGLSVRMRETAAVLGRANLKIAPRFPDPTPNAPTPPAANAPDAPPTPNGVTITWSVGGGETTSVNVALNQTQIKHAIRDTGVFELPTGNFAFANPAEAFEEAFVAVPDTQNALAPRRNPVGTVNADKFIGPEPSREADVPREGTGAIGLLEDVNIICIPDLMFDTFDQEYKEAVDDPNGLIAGRVFAAQKGLADYCEKKNDRMAILDCMPGLSAQATKRDVYDVKSSFGCDNGQVSLYYPWIQIPDPRPGKEKEFLVVPPSGHVAGVWSRVSTERGVHKAPANEILRGVTDLETHLSAIEHGVLNEVGINAIRAFPGEGIKIYGARTLATIGNPSWKYVNVRRIFNYIENSVRRGMKWAVFEPNDQDLWGRLRRNIGAFLLNCWREGMLFGVTPQEAFFVKCDTETNPREMIDLGRVYVEVGIAPVKPAEFVIIKIGEWDGGGSTMEF